MRSNANAGIAPRATAAIRADGVSLALCRAPLWAPQSSAGSAVFDFYASFEVLDAKKDLLIVALLKGGGLAGRKSACMRMCCARPTIRALIPPSRR